MASGKTLYIKGDRDVEVTKPDVTLADLLSMECSDQSLLPKLKTMKILKFKKTGNQRCVISVLKIIACIHGQYPDMEVQNLGETDMIVTYEDQKTPSYAWHLTKTAFVTAVTFCGAAFSIMAFNNDVDVTKLFDQIYHLVTGNKPGGITILEIAYSAGLMIGILIFFNHFGKRRFTVDPTPMEVQMRVYENDIQTTLIENAARKEKEIDVGKGGGIHGTGGLFSFIVELGVIADFADRTHTGDKLLFYETCVALGGIIGNIVFLFYSFAPNAVSFASASFASGAVQVLFGIFAGIFVGCWSMALAEILNVFPIFMRRARIVRYASVFVIGAAIGKGLGAGLFFLKGW